MPLKININELSIGEIFLLSKHIKEQCKDLTCMEEIAQNMMRILYCSFTMEKEMNPVVLARFFKVCQYEHLPENIQHYIMRKENREYISPENKYLTLLGTWGDMKEWRERTRSTNCQAFSMNNPDLLNNFPMISALFSQIGFEFPEAALPDKSIMIEGMHKKYGIFCVEEARGSSFIPKQDEFVKPYDVQSVIGFGGMYSTGNIYAVVVFTRKKLNREKAKLFLSINPAIKWTTIEHELCGNIFIGNNKTLSMQDNNNAFIPDSESSGQRQHLKIKCENEKAVTAAEELDMANEYLIEMTAELRESIKNNEEIILRLEEASRAKSRFLSTMSHELRTPLNAIIGFNDLLSNQFYGNLNKKQVEFVRQIGESGLHLLSLINDLLEISKIDSGAMSLEMEKINPVNMVNEVCMMMCEQFYKKNIELNIQVISSLPSIYADVKKCKQIMFNLLSNALKYTPQCGNVDVVVSKSEGPSIKIEVRDTGIGIEADKKGAIFSEFFQSKRVRDEQRGGAGIGLPLTRRLVELHGGMIGLESRVGKGSVFWFTLPVVAGVSSCHPNSCGHRGGKQLQSGGNS
ncbi:MAG: HAMP domain-containing histidine kinase [Candidatus Kuenenia sp.]|nr:HAMP domain-containing histidine kinase [Candidatus Kuenenia hertensis]